MKKKITTLGFVETGFSLFEVVVIVVIIAIMAALIVPRIIARTDQERIAKAKNDIAVIQSALNLYKLDNGFYPTSLQGLSALIVPPRFPPIPQNWKSNGYLQRLPLDPWGRNYIYLNPGLHNPNSVDVFTYGPDGKPGGTGKNATIGNWQ